MGGRRGAYFVDGLPNHKRDRVAFPGFLYAVELKNGLVKIGATWNPSYRVVSFCRAEMVPATRVAVAVTRKNRHALERVALARAGRIGVIHRGKELFYSLPFKVAAQIINQVTRLKDA